MENTELYFRPVRTMGRAPFSTGNATNITLDLGLSFSMQCIVPQSVYVDEASKVQIERIVFDATSTELGNELIAMTSISDRVRDIAGDRVASINVLGINGVTELQTLISLDPDATPMVSNVLYVKEDGTLALKPAISIQFKSAT